MWEDVLKFEVILFILLNVVAMIAFLYNLQNTLQEIGVKHQLIQPKKVWRLLIPVYNIFYLFFLVRKVAASLYQEFKANNWNTKPVVATYHLGMMMGVLAILMILPFTGVFIWICFTCVFFLYWIGLFSMRRLMHEQHS